MRRTKIVATLGPATDTPESIEKLIQAGVNVVRLNFSHGSSEDHALRAKMVRDAAKKLGVVVGILGDLQGPKIRIDRFKEGKIFLEQGDAFFLDSDLGVEDGDINGVGLTYKTLPQEVVPGDELLLDDGRIIFIVKEIKGNRIHCEVVNGGALSNNKGINRRNGGLSAEALTEKDIKDIQTAADINVDFLAVSFPRSAEDMHYARRLMKEAGGNAAMVSKLERAEVVVQPVLDEIILASDVIMVARGDLGVEIGDAHLPLAQKNMINRCRKLNRIVITATQMMETMIENPIPTRAEVFDVANAVIDGTDAVMLSGETAMGAHPYKVVEIMSDICEKAEQSADSQNSAHRMDLKFDRVDEGIAMATMYAANHMDIKAIGALTESGSTAKWMSRISSGIPIFALTNHEKTCRLVSLYRGVYPVLLTEKLDNPLVANRVVIDHLITEQVVEDGDQVIVTKGDLMGRDGGTNQMKVIRVGNHNNA
ncbi:pyruvate kinase [Leucothrix arctica]|uniref:Pyruvate kinase n=1 Tax=Leucothrix arctica TaxID=1481894 RepID=A0A317CJG3_9GAMM|nr:pyruvate kinase [Leucothrix arctica]PWQ98704.1 pyruvate kinase [Leucothrix arctica]